MAVPPFLPAGTSTTWFQLGYSLIFFAAAFIVALHPERLTSRLGKILCPMLLVLVTVIFVGCLIHPVANTALPLAPYDHMLPSRAF